MKAELFSYDELDRTFYEVLRLELVALGYLPDITQYTVESDYAAAKEAIVTSGKEVIELFGVGASIARDEKTNSKITIDRKSGGSGTIGSSGLFYYEPYTDGTQRKFRKMAYPDQTKNIRYEIRTIAKTRAYEVIMQDILYNLFDQKKYLNTIDVNTELFTDKKFLVKYEGDVDVSVVRYKERMFSYLVPDIYVNNPKVNRSGIVPLTSVGWCTKLVSSQAEFIPANVQGAVCLEESGDFLPEDFDNSFL